jgi:uncharacterized protein YjbI with pentapeptide repeats
MGRVILAVFGSMALAVVLAGNAIAWTDNIKKDQDVNTVCKFEPGGQCTGAVRIGINLEGVDMSNASMTTMRLDKANLRRANLSGAILQLSNLKGADLTLANLERAHLHAVNLRGANLMLANLTKASLLDADLRGANLTGANLTDAILIKARFGNAIWTDGRVCAEGSVGECR